MIFKQNNFVVTTTLKSSIMKNSLIISLLFIGVNLAAQTPAIPTCKAEDTAGVMSDGYWAIWNDEELTRIDQDIEKYRKADAWFRTGDVMNGTTVKVEQISSEFIFGASAFNWNQLGSKKANTRYRELFGTLFNRATIPFYWSTFEKKPGFPRYEETMIDTEHWWTWKSNNPSAQPHWRRPCTDPIVDWCKEHGVKVHGHPLVWGNRKTYPLWMQYVDLPEKEQMTLDTLEFILPGSAHSKMAASYSKMSPAYIKSLLPEYIKNQEERSYGRINDIMSRYQGRIDSYDVVNESAVDYSRGVQDPGLPMCKSVYGIMFSDYTFKSFKKAEACNSGKALLNINDYVVDDRYVEQVQNLLLRGAKIDVIGSQMHLFQPQQCLDIAAGTFSDKDKLVTPEAIREHFSKLGSFGVPTCLSEITITSAGEDEKGEMIQAIISRNLYRMWFSLPSMMGITWWNVVDKCGASGEPAMSGLFHRNMTPKTAFYALDQLINKEWKTNLELTPDSEGKVRWRGFKGVYKITWTDASGKEQTQEFKL